MNDATKKCIQEAADLIDKGIYSYSENDDGVKYTRLKSCASFGGKHNR